MIQLDNISKRYGSRVLFDGLSYQFPDGERVALVGANGAGKTTLLRIITSEEEPTTGRVVFGQQKKVGYLPQEPNRNPKSTVIEECLSGARETYTIKCEIDALLERLEHDHRPELLNRLDELQARFAAFEGYDLEPTARRILKGLGFADDLLGRPPTVLSGGWRMRLELAKIFLAKPDILLLDEPTNHLDLPSLAWVESFLAKYSGTLVFVSHDRPLLNRLATVTVEISPMGLMAFKGNFDKFVLQKEARLEQLASERAQLGRRKKQLEEFITRFGAKASKAKQAQSKAKMLAKLQAMESDLPEEELAASMSLKLPDPQRAARTLLKIKDLAIGYADKTLAKDITLSIERGMKIAVIGANGIGKSTFVKTIAERINPISGSIALDQMTKLSYFAQDQLEFLDPKASLVDNVVHADTSVTVGRARQILGSLLFRGDDVYKPVHVLSGGEKNRVGLACMLLKPANFLVLDEPTNHLDMQSVAVLAQALSDYEGTILFVSHDRDFIDDVCTHVFVMLPDGRHALFEGNLDSYARLSELSGFPNILNSDPTTTTQNTKQPKNIAKNPPTENVSKPNNTRKLQQLESKIETQKILIQKLDQTLYEGSSLSFEDLAKISQQRASAQTILEQLEEEWLILSDSFSNLLKKN